MPNKLPMVFVQQFRGGRRWQLHGANSRPATLNKSLSWYARDVRSDGANVEALCPFPSGLPECRPIRHSDPLTVPNASSTTTNGSSSPAWTSPADDWGYARRRRRWAADRLPTYTRSGKH